VTELNLAGINVEGSETNKNVCHAFMKIANSSEIQMMTPIVQFATSVVLVQNLVCYLIAVMYIM